MTKLREEVEHYGALQLTELRDDVDTHVEEIKICGYAVLPSIVDTAELDIVRARIDAIYARQETDLGAEYLRSIGDLYIARAPLAYDETFVRLACLKPILDVVGRLLGSYFILNQQNAVINMPGQQHHQGLWHRDLPYQNFVVSKPLAVSALVAIDDFSCETGGTVIVPYTHKQDVLPSSTYITKHRVNVEAKAGSVVLFDALLLHKAGQNSSREVRRGVNHLYSIPIIAQQYDLPGMMGDKYKKDPFLAKLLGYEARVPATEVEWRSQRRARSVEKQK
jgi:ectoine hydroxylase-related dioxygenase (phytanoyl-CoA dioxygenase family)